MTHPIPAPGDVPAEAPGVPGPAVTAAAAGTTQTRHPTRASIRTFLAALVGLLAILPAIDDTVHLSKTWPWFASLLIVATAVTRVLAIPSVEVWLRDNKLTSWIAARPPTP